MFVVVDNKDNDEDEDDDDDNDDVKNEVQLKVAQNSLDLPVFGIPLRQAR